MYQRSSEVLVDAKLPKIRVNRTNIKILSFLLNKLSTSKESTYCFGDIAKKI
tara:strand:- start:3972 stop:4127 length:156 start_codon:yes stop_codon:yes gene_type:complete